MAIIGCIFAGLVAGMFCGGWTAIRKAGDHDFPAATRMARCSIIAAFLVGALSTFPFLGWPWKPREVSLAEEVTRTVEEPVTEIKTVWRWYVWPTKVPVTRSEMKQVTETVSHTVTVKVFSILMLLPMALVGALAAGGDIILIRLAWRRFR